MSASLLDQALQIRASVVYDDSIASAHTVGVAEAQTTIEGDINVLRTLVKNFLGKTNWYDASDITLDAVQNKMFTNQLQPSGLIDVATGTGLTSVAFDTAIKTIAGHNDGGGNSTTGGVIVQSTKAHRLIVRDHDSQDAIDDGTGNEVYGRLSWSGTQYVVTWYSWKVGVQTAYNFTATVDVDLMYVLVSEPFKSLTWDHFIDGSFHDTAGFTGSVADDNVVVDGMTLLLNGLVTQAQVNLKLDKLGSTANGEGASGIAIEDASTYYTGADVEAALNEIEAQIGGDTSTTYDFTTDGLVLADNDAVYAALNKLNEKWGDLASVANGEGASLVGVEDTGGYYTGTDVEAVLQEIGASLEGQSVVKVEFTTTVVINGGVPWTLPGGLTYTPAANGQNLDVTLSGAHQMSGGNDYTEVAGAPSTQITWAKTIPVGRNIILWSRQ